MHVARKLIEALTVVVNLACSPLAAAETLDLQWLGEVTAPPVSGEVLGGDPANMANWPATLVFRTSTGGCTVTAVGERVVLTAAHCVANGAAGKVTVEGKAVSILCRHHPSYPGDHTADFALCSASGALERFERVNQDPSILKMGSSIQLLGYGCIAEGGRDRQFGILFEGTAKITQLTKNNLYTITRGGAAVCFGDSGGGAFLVQGQRRRLIGVNSRGDISTFSWLSTTSEKSFLDWAGAWASEQELMICGLHDGATGCRS